MTINGIECNILIFDNLKLIQFLTSLNLSSTLNLIIIYPNFFINLWIILQFKELYGRRTSSYKHFIFIYNHLTQFKFAHLFILELCNVISINFHEATLSVEQINYFFFCIIMTFYREIFIGTIFYFIDNRLFLQHILIFKIKT